MKDVAHHQKHLQRKVLRSVRAEESKQTPRELSSSAEEESLLEEVRNDRLTPEYEGEIFDPHHRKPRMFKRNHR